MPKLYLIITLSSLIAVTNIFAQQPKNSTWMQLKNENLQRPALTQPWITPDRYTGFSLDIKSLKSSLAKAGKESSTEILTAKHIIELPMPDGTLARFQVIESPVMAAELAAKFPEITTYRGRGVDDPQATLRMSLIPHGFSAQILSPSGTCYIDRLFKNDAASYACYTRKNHSGAQQHQLHAKGKHPKEAEDGEEAGKPAFQCQVLSEAPQASKSSLGITAARSSGATLRTYRIAVATTGEYTAFHGGSVADGQAAVVQAINRVTGIYEQELSIRLTLVANNDLLIYTNSNNDPYDDDDADQMIDINTATINGIIGSANYDIGHVFSTGGGGLASLGSVCGSFKGEGVTGLASPNGDSFWVDFVAHEIGHQFGANHTFNGNKASCSGGSRNASTAYEPGSGSTIMAYAGICGSDNIQSDGDPLFHTSSYDEIRAFVENIGCAVNTATGNAIPTVSAGNDYTIPRLTPFALTATGNDTDTGDALTYLWEERDLGPSNSPTASDNGSSPLFRVWSPTADPTRTFPRLSDLLNNTTVDGEQLPTTNRTMNFRATVRDNHSGGGGVNQDDMQVTVYNTAGPFAITAPNTSGLTLSGSTTVTWNVASTSSAPINTSHVDILLSTDGGITFDTVIVTNTPNDGSEQIALPIISTTTARIKVRAVNNIYFDVSNNNFTITPPAGPTLQMNDITVTEGDSGTSLATFTVSLAPAAASTVTVNYATSNGSATADSDYVAKNDQLQFNAGVTSQQITVTINGDTTIEGDETFHVTLSNPVNAFIGVSQGTTTIENDDLGPPVITSASTSSGFLNVPFSYQITSTQTPTSFGVTGFLPNGITFNSLTGLLSGTPTGNGTSPLTISATNAIGTGSQPLTISINTDPLTAGLDSTGLTWIHGGNADWVRITGSNPITYDGVDAAKSGNISDDEESSLSIDITGPDTLFFFWKVSSEQFYDFLICEIDGIKQFSISGDVPWQQRHLTIPSGPHTVRWSYQKDYSTSDGTDEGFLDQVLLASQSAAPLITSSLDITGAASQPFSYQILTTQTPTSYNATGLPTGLSINTLTGIISGVTTQTGTFSVNLSATNGQGTGNTVMQLTIGTLLSLETALDTENLNLQWIGGGNAPWTAQTTVTNDGTDAATSGPIGDSQESILQTTVTGPDILIFHWKADSEDTYDYLQFELDGITQFFISGNTAWEKKFTFIPRGQHSIRWSFIKDASGIEGADAGYLDQVSLLSKTFKISSLIRSGAGNADVKITFPTMIGLKYSVERSTDLVNWSHTVQDNINGTDGEIEVTDIGGGSGSPQHFYRVIAALQ